MTTGQDNRTEPFEPGQEDRVADPFAAAPGTEPERHAPPADWPELVPTPEATTPDPQSPFHIEAVPEAGAPFDATAAETEVTTDPEPSSGLDPSFLAEVAAEPTEPAETYPAEVDLESEAAPETDPAPEGLNKASRRAIGATNTEYQTPLGEVRKTREDMLGPLTETGFYQLENAAGKWLVSCSLLSSAETLLDDSESTDNHQPVDRGNSPAAWLTLLAIVLIVVESVLYHRRKVG